MRIITGLVAQALALAVVGCSSADEDTTPVVDPERTWVDYTLAGLGLRDEVIDFVPDKTLLAVDGSESLEIARRRLVNQRNRGYPEFMDLAFVHLLDVEFENAEAAFSSAIEEASTGQELAAAAYGRSSALCSLSRHDEAWDALRVAMQARPEDPVVATWRLGLADASGDLLERAAAIDHMHALRETGDGQEVFAPLLIGAGKLAIEAVTLMAVERTSAAYDRWQADEVRRETTLPTIAGARQILGMDAADGMRPLGPLQEEP